MSTAGGITISATSTRSRNVRPRNERRAMAKAASVDTIVAATTEAVVTMTLFMNQIGIRPSWRSVA